MTTAADRERAGRGGMTDHFGVSPGDLVTYDGRECVVLEVERRAVAFPIIYLHDFGCHEAHDWCVGMHADMWLDGVRSGKIRAIGRERGR